MFIIFLALFLGIMIGFGVWGMRRTTTLNDFFLGGRNIGPWISAFAYGTTYFSAVLFIGFAGKLGWGFGLKALWVAAGNVIIGSLLAWKVLGSRTRRMTKNLEAMTMPEFLYERYGGKYIKMISATIIFVFLLPYSASVFKGLGHLFEAYFHIPYEAALLLMVVITGVYLILGGYFAITLTDFIQGLLMIFGIIAVVGVLAHKGGGLFEVITLIPQKYAEHVPVSKQPSCALLVCLVFMTSFGVWGLPQMVQKFYAIKDERFINKAAIVSTGFALVISFSAYFIGALAHIFYDQLPLVGGRPAFDQIVPGLLTTYISGGLIILILLLVLSASMSTLSSLILVSASSVAIDMYKGHINPRISKERSLAMMRFLSGVFIALSYFIARYEFGVIVTLMSLSWGAVAGSFMAPYVYGLYWRQTTLAGAKAGMITGFILAVVLFFILGPDRSPIASTIAMIIPFLVVPLVSMYTKAPSAAIVAKAFKNI